jgi:hypothetical protein
MHNTAGALRLEVGRAGTHVVWARKARASYNGVSQSNRGWLFWGGDWRLCISGWCFRPLFLQLRLAAGLSLCHSALIGPPRVNG